MTAIIKELSSYLTLTIALGGFFGAIAFLKKTVEELKNKLFTGFDRVDKRFDNFSRDLLEMRSVNSQIQIELGQLKTMVEIGSRHLDDKISAVDKRLDRVENSSSRKLNG